MSNRTKNSNGCQDRCTQGPDYLSENGPVTGTVDKCALFQLSRNGFYVGLYQNNIIRSYNSGDDIGHEVIGKS